STLPHTTVQQVAQAHAVEGLTLAWLHEFVLENRARVAVEHYLQAALEFVGGEYGHSVLPRRARAGVCCAGGGTGTPWLVFWKGAHDTRGPCFAPYSVRRALCIRGCSGLLA